MTDAMFLTIAAAAVAATYRMTARIAGVDRVGWWIGLLCGLGALAALSVAREARDVGFMAAMLAFATFGAAMSVAEMLRHLRVWRQTRNG